jgi:uncharacterized protein (DUF58 family)
VTMGSISLCRMLPETIRADGTKYGRPPFAAGQRLFALLCAGLIFVPLMFVTTAFGWALLAWNILVLSLYLADLRSLPPASDLKIERSFDGVLNQLQPSHVTLSITNPSWKALHCTVVDDVPQSLILLPPELTIDLPAKGSASVCYEVRPAQRGNSTLSQGWLEVVK